MWDEWASPWTGETFAPRCTLWPQADLPPEPLSPPDRGRGTHTWQFPQPALGALGSEEKWRRKGVLTLAGLGASTLLAIAHQGCATHLLHFTGGKTKDSSER